MTVVTFSGVAAETRGFSVSLRENADKDAAVIEEVELFGASYALVIGIDAYENGWPHLSNAVKDATLIADLLKERGFSVDLKLNLKARELDRALEDFFLLRGEDPNARLFAWFAGHGHTENDEGFLIPADAPRPEAGGRFRVKALSLRRMGEYVRLAQSKHAFAVFDSCFSGTVFDSARALPPAAVTRATTLPVRQFLTSGDAGQTVSDDGGFRELFIRALKGEENADANGDGYLTASEVGLFLTDRVTNLTQSKQTPRYGKLRDKGWDRGDFVFGLPTRSPNTKPGTPPTNLSNPSAMAEAAKLQQETVFWESIKESGDAAAYQAYLAQYPGETFSALAEVKIASIQRSQALMENERKNLQAEKERLEEERRRLASEAERRNRELEARLKAERERLAAERTRLAAAERRSEAERQRRQLAAGMPNRSAETTPAEKALPISIELPAAEFVLVPKGTRVEYDTQQFQVIDAARNEAEILTKAGNHFKLTAGIFQSGERVFTTVNDGKIFADGCSKPSLKVSKTAHAALLGLFPLKVGNGTKFDLEEYAPPTAFDVPYVDEWSFDLVVEGAEAITVVNRRLDTFVIRTMARSSLGRVFEQRQWYHPKSGLVVKSVREWSGKQQPAEQYASLKNTDAGSSERYELRSVTFPAQAKNTLK